MLQYNLLLRAFFSAIFAFSAFCSVFFLGANFASATTYEITGWGWAADDNISQGFGASLAGLGWISFSNKSDSTAIPYGVFIDAATGNFSGYAWSPNAGWVTFNAIEMQKCSINPGDTCPPGPPPSAHINIVSSPITGAITGGTGKVTGWARACAVFVTGCSGAVRPDSQTGTWDGWISLSGATYGLELDTAMAPPLKFKGPLTTGFFLDTPLCGTCYAWGGGVAGNDTGFGWGMNLGGLNVSLVTASLSPLLSFWADQTMVASGQSTNLHWITSSNIVSCAAASTPVSPIWSGPKPPASTMRSQATGAIVGAQTYTLQCQDSVGNTTPLRTIDITPIPVPVSVNGACGLANGVPSRSMPAANLCSAGNASLVTQVGDTWQWSCNGINGGTNASCSAIKKKAVRIIAI